jgi:branched-chain amino acid transport system substrate-binding protein
MKSRREREDVHMKRSTVVIGMVTIVVLAVAITGVGSAQQLHRGSQPRSRQQPRSASAKKSPINVLGTGTLSGATNPAPEVAGGYEAAAAAINAAGGIDGHPIKVTMCDDQANPNIAQGCAEKAVANHDAAVLASNDAYSSSILPTLQKANIPFVGNLTETTLDATSRVSFPIAPGALNGIPASGAVAKKIGCKKVASLLIEISGITGALQAGVESGLKAEGIQYVGTIDVPATAADYTSPVAAAEAKGADCIVGVLGSNGITAFLTALKESGGNVKAIIPGQSIAPLNTLGGVANGAYLFSNGRAATDKSPGVAHAASQIRHYSSGTPITSNSLGAWAAMEILKAGLEGVHGAYTGSDLLKSMDHLTNVSTDGLFPPYTTTKPGPLKGEPRVFNATFITYEVEGTTTKTIGGFTAEPK